MRVQVPIHSVKRCGFKSPSTQLRNAGSSPHPPLSVGYVLPDTLSISVG
ncbi:hypothetical protein LINPERHAP1_LOCUS15501, partial [Linum perenne]